MQGGLQCLVRAGMGVGSGPGSRKEVRRLAGEMRRLVARIRRLGAGMRRLVHPPGAPPGRGLARGRGMPVRSTG